MASVDTLEDNTAFAKKESADFPLLADPTKETARKLRRPRGLQQGQSRRGGQPAGRSTSDPTARFWRSTRKSFPPGWRDDLGEAASVEHTACQALGRVDRGAGGSRLLSSWRTTGTVLCTRRALQPDHDQSSAAGRHPASLMAPMTRSASPGGVPGSDVAADYRRRAEGGVGLIVTEGAWIPHPSAGY